MEKDIVELCAKPQKRHKSNKVFIVKGYGIAPPHNFGWPQFGHPLFER